MPEGDSIHRLARRLDGRLSGKVVARSSFRVARFATSDLSDFVLVDVRAHGKHLLMRFVHDEREPLTLHSHLRMDGSWNFYDAGRSVPIRRQDDVRVRIGFTDGMSLVGFTLPVLELVETAREQDVIGHIGPDLLGEFDVDEADRRLLQAPDTPVIQALLDQRNVAGIGNLWAVETCFLRGVYPWTPVGGVDRKSMLELAAKMMRFSLDVVPGMVTTGDRRRGETHWVYGRYRRPCRRCGTPIAFRKGGSGPYDRETWWCPSCQPAPAAMDDR